MKSKKVGLIVEDKSDRDVIEQTIRKLVQGNQFKVVPVYARGCGRIMSKCRRWATNLHSRGCTALILVQDLDDKQHHTLYSDLINSLAPSPIALFTVIIPIRMIEAWLLSDGAAIRSTFRLNTTPEIPNPQSVVDPKSKLEELVYVHSGKKRRYISTIHNGPLSAALNLEKVRNCTSFKPFEDFISGVFPKTKTKPMRNSNP